MKKTKIIGEDSTSPIKISRNRGSGKKRADLFERLRNTEHPLDNIFPESVPEPIQPILSYDSPSYTNLTNDSLSYNNPSNPIQSQPTAPVKDFQRVPNSITRDAIPQKFFKGTSKSTYDALYLKTRGAVNPVRTIKATKRELMKWIGISHVTIFKHLKHLESVGLLKIEQQLGSHDGSVYEVFIPEEMEPIQSYDSPSYTNLTNDSQSDAIQSNKVVSLPYNNVVLDRTSNPIENKGLKDTSNTSLKTNTNNDDEVLADFLANFTKLSHEFTSKGLSRTDRENWKKLSELLILEFRIAARRTNTVSSIPAFLTEVLRRRLREAPPAQNIKSKVKPDTIGKPETETYEIKALDEKGREAALLQLQEFAGDDFLEDFKKWYTPDDWNWLTGELEKDTGELEKDRGAPNKNE